MVAAAFVYIQKAFEIPHFNAREGYFGTESIRSFLYVINDPYAIYIVAAIWFLYGAVAGTVIAIVFKSVASSRK